MLKWIIKINLIKGNDFQGKKLRFEREGREIHLKEVNESRWESKNTSLVMLKKYLTNW